jgi:hypothetical protein
VNRFARPALVILLLFTILVGGCGALRRVPEGTLHWYPWPRFPASLWHKPEATCLYRFNGYFWKVQGLCYKFPFYPNQSIRNYYERSNLQNPILQINFGDQTYVIYYHFPSDVKYRQSRKDGEWTFWRNGQWLTEDQYINALQIERQQATQVLSATQDV